MNRLTFKDINPFTNEEQYYPKSVQDKNDKKIIDFTMQSKCNNKLGKLEDLEEKYDFSLDSLEYMLQGNDIFKKLIMKNENGRYIFTMDNLTEEEKKELHRRWCNGG